MRTFEHSSRVIVDDGATLEDSMGELLNVAQHLRLIRDQIRELQR